VSAPDGTPPWSRVDDALLVACAAVPTALAASGAGPVALAAHDEGVVRAVGFGWTGLLRGLDALASAALVGLLPLGTRSLRASIACALLTGLAGAIAYVSARQLVAIARPSGASPALGSAAAAVAVLTALLAPAWQIEATAPGGSVLGASLVLAVLALAASSSAPAPLPVAARGGALVLGLAASYEPLVLAGAVAAAAPWVVVHARALRGLARAERVDAALGFAAGLLPAAVAASFARRAPEIALQAAPLASPLGERSGAAVHPLAFALAEVGHLVLIAAAGGAALAWLAPRARPLLASLGLVMAVGIVAAFLRVPASRGHVGAPILAAFVAAHLLAAVALAGVVSAIARAPVPFAQASAALVVVLELVLPVRAADESLTRRESRASRATAVWDEIAWGAAPPAAVLLITEPAQLVRIAAARAAGQMRDDLLVVPRFAFPSRMTDRALLAEPRLAPLYRDIALGAAPEELSLSSLAAHRPLLAAFDPRWDRALARHFVPVGLTTRFEPEPRGAGERRRALEQLGADKDRLSRIMVARPDPELAAVTASMLRARAITMAACGDRDVLARALDDLRPFAPDDAVATTLVRRTVTSKGPIVVGDLLP